MSSLLRAIYEDEDILLVNKPAGLVCHPTKDGPLSSLIGRLRLHFSSGISPQLINRLDRETSGLVVVAKKSSVARELRLLWERRLVTKEYLAVVHGLVKEPRGRIDAPIGSDHKSEVAIKECVTPDGAAAITDFLVLRSFTSHDQPLSLLQVLPQTGRKHQIRVHLKYYGHPVVGDKIYGSDETLYLKFVKGELTDGDRAQLLLKNHALHAHRLSFFWRNKSWSFGAEPEEEFKCLIQPQSPENLVV